MDKLQEKIQRLSDVDRELWEERAAIMEYEGKMTREKAELKAWECLFDFTGNNS